MKIQNNLLKLAQNITPASTLNASNLGIGKAADAYIGTSAANPLGNGFAAVHALGDDRGIYSFKSDDRGRQLLWHYLFGEGEDLVVKADSAESLEVWGPYMRNNKGDPEQGILPLSEQIQAELFSQALTMPKGSCLEVEFSIHMEIENGEDIIGYQYLHGTNADVGDFQIKGNLSKDENGNVSYYLTCTWNDLIDPNASYSSDLQKDNLANKIPFADPQGYRIEISWYESGVITPWQYGGKHFSPPASGG